MLGLAVGLCEGERVLPAGVEERRGYEGVLRVFVKRFVCVISVPNLSSSSSIE